MSLESNGVDQVRSLRKILTRLHGTNFCTSSARFAPSFVRQPNGPKCIQIVKNTPKHDFIVQWGGSVAFVAKNSERLRGTNFFIRLARFALSFVTQPNGANCTKNSIKHYETWVLGSIGWMGTFIAKNSDTTSWHELLHHFGPFCIGFCKATKRPRMHPNSTIHTKTWV